MPYVTANGLRFHVQYLGEPTAPPVVMVHGMLSGSLASWYFGLAPVLAESHHVALYDQRGHGLSERPLRGYTLTELAADLEALTETMGPCALVGHSFGGLVAMRHAIDHPDRVTAVALVDSFVPGPAGAEEPGSGGDGPRGADIGGMDIESMRAWEHDRRRSRERIPAGSGSGSSDGGPRGGTDAAGGSSSAGGPGLRRRRRRATGEQILLGGTTVLSDLRRDSQVDSEALAELAVPLLCVMGAASPFRTEVDALAHRLPPDRCQFAVLDGGHALHLDAPAELADIVTEFLGRQRLEGDGLAAGGSAASGSVASGSVASGSVAGGPVASGPVASGLRHRQVASGLRYRQVAVGAGAQGGRHG
jgi:pimeloyl-ACP methyl ester carboxylesterase